MTTPRTASLRLVMYVRVSTAGQLDGYGLEAQEKDCRRWAKKHGHKVVKVCTDGAVSGKTADDERPGLTEALGIIAAGEADGILAPTLDRVARELTVQEAALSVIWAYGSRAFTVDHGEHVADDEDDPMRKFVRQVMGAAADLERGLIAKRLRNGRKTKAAAGGYAHGAPAYGQKAVDKELTEDDDEAAVLAQMRAWQTEGLSIRAITAKLNDAEIPTKRGGRWHPTTVNRLLSPDARAAARQQSAHARAAEREQTKRSRADRILHRLT
ncbi:recombinase family protein [Streptomyces parvus]|uniref:recombinase family protein n=1 Tax=Streptomyces parvus TaxID=66428 RepID=UPI0021008B88|nr:recombinase family protein [Streptomyces parvus]MCQ1582640.1 recombinase family protein [Streptomyces parvus]